MATIEKTQSALAAHFVTTGVPDHLVHESPDGETVVVDLGAGQPAVVFGWWKATPEQDDAGEEPADRLDWTLYGADNEIASTYDGDLDDATRYAREFVES